jgi:hypothetical protein
MENRQYIYQKFEDTVFKLLVNVLPVFPSATDSNYLFDFFKILVNILSVLPSVTYSNYPSGVFKLLVNVKV